MPSDVKLQTQVRQVLERFNELVSTKNLQVVAEFAPGDEVMLIGSDSGEIAVGSQELESFFARIFARDTIFSWEWDRIDVSHTGNLVWFFAEGRIVLSTVKEQRKLPYRITGVLEHHGERLLWRHYHGSEPVTGE